MSPSTERIPWSFRIYRTYNHEQVSPIVICLRGWSLLTKRIYPRKPSLSHPLTPPTSFYSQLHVTTLYQDDTSRYTNAMILSKSHLEITIPITPPCSFGISYDNR